MLKNILSKLLGLDRKEKTEPVEPTTTQSPATSTSATGHPKSASPPIPPPPPSIQPSTNPTIQCLASPTQSSINPSIQSAAPPLIHPSTHPSIQPFDPPGRRLTGKVAKLPLEIRIIINQMLDEAETYKSIVARLNELGYPGFFEQNIQRWKDHGYQRWVEFQEKRLAEKLENEEAEELAKDPKTATNLIEANEIKLARQNGRHLDAVSEWDTETTMKNSKFYFQLGRSVNQQLAERTKRERFKLEAELKRRQQEISEEGKQKIRDLTNPLTQAERKAILDAIDDILGIRIDPDDDGARLSPAAAIYNDTVSAGPPPTPSVTQPHPFSCQGPAIPENTTKPNNTVEKSTDSKAESSKNTVENISHLSVKSVVDQSTSDSTSVTSVLSASNDSTLRTPNSALPANTAENSTNSKAENQKNTVENHDGAITNALAQPEPKTANVDPAESSHPPMLPSSHLSLSPIQSSTNPPIQQVYRDPFPISPLATTPPPKKQPRNHIPLLDLYGQLIQWVPRDEELTIENVVGFGNRRGQNTCWLNPKLVDPPPALRNVPVVSWDGQILEWVPAEIEPFEKAEPIRSRRYLHYKIGWWEQGREQMPQYNSSAGCLVA